MTSPVDIVWHPILTISLLAALTSRFDILSDDSFMNFVIAPALDDDDVTLVVFTICFSSRSFLEEGVSTLLNEWMLFDDVNVLLWPAGVEWSRWLSALAFSCRLVADVEWTMLDADIDDVSEIVESLRASLFWFSISSWYWLKSPVLLLCRILVGVETLEIESSRNRKIKLKWLN